MKPRLLRRAALLCALFCLLVGMVGSTSAWSAGGSPVVCLEKAGVMVTGTASDTLMAVDLRNGRVLWSQAMAGSASVKLLAYGPRVIAIDPQGIVIALEAQSGTQAWGLPALGTPRDAPQVMGDTLFLRTQAGKQDLLQAIDLERGTVRWTAPYRVVALLPAERGAVLALCQESPATSAPGGNEASPSPAPGASESTVLVVRRLDLASGKPTWAARPLPGTLKDPAVELLFAGLVVVASVTKPSSATGTASPAPGSSDGAITRVTALRVADGSLAWERHFVGAEVDQVSLAPTHLVTHRKDGQIQAWSIEKGTPSWELTPASLALPGASGSGSGATDVRVGSLEDGLVYVLAQTESEVGMVALDAIGGTERGRFKSTGGVTAGPWVMYETYASEESVPRDQAFAVVLLDILVPPPAKAGGGPGKNEPVHRLVALDRTTRTTLAQRWSFDLSEPLDAPPQVSYRGERSFLVLRQGENIVWLDLASGKVETKAAVTGDIDGEPILVGSNALVKCKDGAFRLYDMASGRSLWSVSTKPWFAKQKLPNLIFVIILSVLIVAYIFMARGGRRLFIRRIAGLAALDEAVGRAAEMGRPVLFTTGMYDVDDNQTLSALSILGHVAQRAAEYETRIVVPCRWAVAMTSADEVVKTAFLKAGRPDAYRSDDVRYMSEDQFGYVAGVDGIMLRERPAANFYMGQFFGESLILAETGNTTGAIQIAGTAATAQMPFFVAACDYTLLGEELFAASAYLSDNPLEVGSLKGQDVAKALLIVLIVVCSLLLPWFPGIRTWLSS